MFSIYWLSHNILTRALYPCTITFIALLCFHILIIPFSVVHQHFSHLPYPSNSSRLSKTIVPQKCQQRQSPVVFRLKQRIGGLGFGFVSLNRLAPMPGNVHNQNASFSPRGIPKTALITCTTFWEPARCMNWTVHARISCARTRVITQLY